MGAVLPPGAVRDGTVLPPGAVRDGGRLTSRGRVAPGYPTVNASSVKLN